MRVTALGHAGPGETQSRWSSIARTPSGKYADWMQIRWILRETLHYTRFSQVFAYRISHDGNADSRELYGFQTGCSAGL